MVPSPPSNRRRKGAGAMSYNHTNGTSSNRATASPNRPVQSNNNSRSRSVSAAVGEGANGASNPFISGAVSNARQHTTGQLNAEEYGFSASSDAVLESVNQRRESSENQRERYGNQCQGTSGDDGEEVGSGASRPVDHSYDVIPEQFYRLSLNQSRDALDEESDVDLLPGAMSRMLSGGGGDVEPLLMGRTDSLDEEVKGQDDETDDQLDIDPYEDLAENRSNRPSRSSFEVDEIEGTILAMAKTGAAARCDPGIGGAGAFEIGQLLKNTGGAGPNVNNNPTNAHPLHNAAAVARSHAGAAVGGNQLFFGGPAPPLGWQGTKHSLKERFSFMFCNEILSDVHFIVGRGDQRQRIPAHKFVLSVGSAVFDAMFNGAMAAEAQAQGAAANNDEIELPDVEPAAFIALLKFLYSDDVQIGPESVMTTLYTAKKYAVPSLENACVDFLKRNLSADNAFMLLTQARLFDEPQLAALCLEMIDKHTAEALNAEGFTEIDLETLCAVMERDTLRIREAALYQAVVRWSTEECHRHQLPVTPEHQRQVLNRALSLIRFPLMTVEEFAQSAAQSGILTDREALTIFLYFTVNPKPSVGFLDVPRCCVTGKEQVVNRFQRIEGRWGYSGTPDRIKFNVDRRIFVVGFGLYGSIHGPTEYQVTIQIIHCGTGKVLGSNDTTFPCDGSSSTFRVLFKEPVEVSPCVTYIASACLKGPDSHYGTKGLRRIVHQSPSSGCVTFQFTYAAGNNNGTSVEDGQIPEIIFYTKLS